MDTVFTILLWVLFVSAVVRHVVRTIRFIFSPQKAEKRPLEQRKY